MIDQTNDQLERILDRLRRRLRITRAVTGAQRGVLVGLALASLVAIITLFRADTPSLALMAWTGIVCTLVGALLGFAMPVDRLRVARALDAAAESEDRFASAVQLLEHRSDARSRLVLVDALKHVAMTPLSTAFPIRAQRALRWAPVPAIVIAGSFFLEPGVPAEAGPVDPEVSPEEWTRFADELRDGIDEIRDPEEGEDEDLSAELERLAQLLEENPEKKKALERIAKLRADLERRQRQNGTDKLSMEKAAQAVKSSNRLEEFAKAMREGSPEDAAEALERLAQRVDELSASEFEQISEDMQALARELKADSDLSNAAEQCSNAASSMNSEKLAEAMRRLAEQMRRDAERLKNGSRMGRAQSLLDMLQQRLGKAGSQGKNGRGPGGQGDGKDKGDGAGWGSSNDWTGGSLADNDEARQVEGADPEEREGSNTTLSTVSRDERVESVQEMRDRYVELIKKAEADLALEGVPVTERDYLRRYFDAIRPDVEPEPDTQSPDGNNE